MTQLSWDELENKNLAEKILHHLAFHSKYVKTPALYQFLLPNNCWLTVEDHITTGGNRSLMFWVVTASNSSLPISSVIRNKALDPAAPWFHIIHPGDFEKALKATIEGIQYVDRNQELNTFIRDNAMQINVNVEPKMQTPPEFSGVHPYLKWLQ